MTHIIKQVTIKSDNGEQVILNNIVTHKSIRQFKEELMDSVSKDKCFIAISCNLIYY